MYLIRGIKGCQIPLTRRLSTAAGRKTVKLTDKPKYPLLTKEATVVRGTGVYNILLDNRLLLTPLGKVVSTEKEGLANLIGEEFRVQSRKLTSFRDFPFTMLLCRSLDLTEEARLDCVKKLRESLGTDTVLFFEKVESSGGEKIPDLDELSEEKLAALRDFELASLQTFFFGKILEDFSRFFKCPPLSTSASVSKIPLQHPECVRVLERFISGLNRFQLVSAFNVHSNLKSIILTVLFLEGVVGPRRCLRLSRLEETLQSSHWGVTDTFDLEEEFILLQLNQCFKFYQFYS